MYFTQQHAMPITSSCLIYLYTYGLKRQDADERIKFSQRIKPKWMLSLFRLVILNHQKIQTGM